MLDFIRNPFKTQSVEEEDAEAQAKRDRIDFHRKNVRNGPVKFKSPSSGQLRRAHDRSIQRNIQKTREAQVRRFFGDQRLAAVARGKLHTVGIGFADASGRPYLVGIEHRTKQQVDAARWLIEHFAHAQVGDTIEISDNVILTSFSTALAHCQVRAGLPTTGLPEGYALPGLVTA